MYTTEMSAWLRDTADNRRLNSVQQSAYYIVPPVTEHFYYTFVDQVKRLLAQLRAVPSHPS